MRTGNYVPMRGSKLLGEKKVKGRENSRFFFSEPSEDGSWLQIPDPTSESFVDVAKTSARA